MSNEVHTEPVERGSPIQASVKVLQFVSRETQIQLRERQHLDRYHRIKYNLEPLGEQELSLVRQRHADDKRNDREWALRHGPRPGGAIVLSIFIEPLLRPIVSRMARERIASTPRK